MNFLSLLRAAPPLVGFAEGGGIGGIGGIGILAVIALVFIAVAAAFFSYIMLRKTVKMAIRMIVVAVILLVAVVGSVSFLWFNSGSSPKLNSTTNRAR